MSRPKVSVSLITYNHEKYIAACLDSVVRQVVNFDLEIIVCDDCSKDRTPEIVAQYALRYPGLIKAVLRETNFGLVKNAISNIQACSGEYIALMEGDDFWVDDDKLQIQAEFLDNNPDCAFCFTNQYTFYEGMAGEQKVFFADSNKPPEKFDLEFLIKHNITVPNNTKMFRRTVMPAVLPDWYYNSFVWDWALHILQARHAQIGYIDRVTLAYRRHPGAVFMSKNEIAILLDSIVTMSGINKELNFEYGYMFNSFWWEYHELAFAYLKEGGYLNFLRYYLKYLFSPGKPSIKIKDDLWLLRNGLFGQH